MKGLFSFQGRFNRAKWWLVGIGSGVAEAIAVAIIFAIFGAPQVDAAGNITDINPISVVLIVIVFVVVIWVGVAAAVKRYHDRNKSGWWILIIFVPLIGSIWYLIECGFLRGTRGPNAYGPDPLAGA
jgi:uncharacterized membrane protein YhaH (DUF805 family)